MPTATLLSQVRKLIEESGWTFYRVARVAKLSRQSVYRFMDGEQTLDAASIQKIVDALKATVKIEREGGK